MLYRVSTARPLDEIGKALEESAARHKFGVIAVHDLRQTMKNKGVDLNMDCRIFEVCNPLQAKKVLESDGALSTFLPCRISVYGTPGAYTLATMRPTQMMKSLGNPLVETVAQEVEKILLAMIDEAANPELGET